MGTEIIFYLWFPWLIKYGRKHVLALVISICALWLLMKYGIYSYGIYIFHPIVIFVCSRICEEYHLIASNYWLAGLQVLTVVIVSIAISAVFDKVVAALLKLAK